MTTKEARTRVEGYLVDQIDAGSFWLDESYKDDVLALAKLGWERAKQAKRVMGYKDSEFGVN